MTQTENEVADKIEKGTAILAAGAIGICTFYAVVELIWKLLLHQP